MGSKSTLTLTVWDKTHSVELDYSDMDIDELITMFKSLAVLAGWRTTIVEEALTEYGYGKDFNEKKD